MRRKGWSREKGGNKKEFEPMTVTFKALIENEILTPIGYA